MATTSVYVSGFNNEVHALFRAAATQKNTNLEEIKSQIEAIYQRYHSVCSKLSGTTDQELKVNRDFFMSNAQTKIQSFATYQKTELHSLAQKV